MREASRTKRTLQNTWMSLLLFLIQLFVGFFSRKIFLDYLGAEVLGLNTTLGNILSFMNLAELGIGLAMTTALFKPIYEDDRETICEILSVEGILFRRVAMVIVGMGACVMLALPFLFPNTETGLPYIYVAFAVFLFGSISSYLWNYRQVLISANQKNYKLLPWMHLVRYSVIGLQILSLLVFHWGIWGWIFLELTGNVATVFVINAVLRREYPWLHKSPIPGKELLPKYRHLIVITKQLFVHKIGSFVLEQTPPLIIYGFVSLTMVTYYGNYMVIVGYVTTSVHIFFASMGAAIGSLVAEGKKPHILNVFWELQCSRVWFASVACFGIYVFANPFISIWLDKQYVLSDSTLLLICIGAFIRMSRSIIDSFRDAYQLFGDIWAPAIEAAINLSASILFGYLWGLNGVLLGSNLSLFIIVLIWRPFYLFHKGLKESYVTYYANYILHISLILSCAYLAIITRKQFTIGSDYSAILMTIPSFLLFVVTSFTVLWLTTKGMRRFAQRIIRIISHKI